MCSSQDILVHNASVWKHHDAAWELAEFGVAVLSHKIY